MSNILDRFTSNAHWLVFILLELISGILLFNYNHYQNSVWLTQANSLVAAVHDWEADVIAYVHLKQVNRTLVDENVTLQSNLDSLRQELARLQKDTTHLDERMRKQLGRLTPIDAHVISNSVQRKNNFITIDKGANDGIKPEMGVVCGNGIVGIVYAVSNHYSLVLPVLNSHSEISCRLRGSEYFGYLRWAGGSSLVAYLEEVPHHAKFKTGDIVETSGFSDVFPAGIYVGKVIGKDISTDGLSYRIKVQLGADQSLIHDVIVFSNPHHKEIDTLKMQVIDLELEEREHISAQEALAKEKKAQMDAEAKKAEAEAERKQKQAAQQQAIQP